MNLSLGFSPCPNDTFIFYGLLHNKIDTKGLTFTPVITDVEELNRKALAGELDLTKVSFATYLYLQESYLLLNSGSALGNNCGPLLISKDRIQSSEVSQYSVAIPGKYTTANFLFNAFFPDHGEKKEMVFSDIECAVLNGTTDLGIIIHENRFTYQKKGLQKVVDLGELWEQTTQHPIPLGGIAVSRTIDPSYAGLIDGLIRESVLYAFAHPEEAIEFVRIHCREMDEDVMRQHIRLYVNHFTLDLGEKGKAAINKFFDYAVARNIISEKKEDLFLKS